MGRIIQKHLQRPFSMMRKHSMYALAWMRSSSVKARRQMRTASAYIVGNPGGLWDFCNTSRKSGCFFDCHGSKCSLPRAYLAITSINHNMVSMSSSSLRQVYILKSTTSGHPSCNYSRSIGGLVRQDSSCRLFPWGLSSRNPWGVGNGKQGIFWL